MKLSELKCNPKNPRTITKEKLESLKKSLKSIPELMKVRPIVIDENNVIIIGNMRYQALVALGYEEIPNEWVSDEAKNWDEEKKREAIIKDNISYGSWAWDVLESEWNIDDLRDWGVDIPEIDVNDITQDDIWDAEERLENSEKERYNEYQESLIKIICPYCLKEFEVKRDEFLGR